MSDDDETLRGRVQRTGEDVIGKLAQDLLSNPLMTGALHRAMETREKATQAQEVAMGALNLPSAADVERLTRRVRSVSQRLESIEDAIDRLDDRLADVGRASRDVAGDDVAERLGRIETALEALVAAQAQAQGPAGAAPAPTDDAPAATSRTRTTAKRSAAKAAGGTRARAGGKKASTTAATANAKAKAASAQAEAAKAAAESAAAAADGEG